MTRRSLFQTAAALPLANGGASFAAPRNRIETERVRLQLRHTWTTVMSSSEYRDNLHLRYTRDGVTGLGAYGIRTRDLLLEREVSWAARRMRRANEGP